jgi:pimeloyl-ACP methyl ester carboxylesterase
MGKWRASAVATVVVATMVVLTGCGQDAQTAAPATSSPPTTPFQVPVSPPVPTPTPTVNPVDLSIAKYQKQKLEWTDCGGGNTCADLQVPLDYTKPNGSTILLRVLKNPATIEDKRIGSIVVNPGGPGGSGYEYARSDQLFSSGVAARYDVVGFDPRGVGRSAPVQCLTPSEADRFYSFDGSPDSDAEATAALLLGRRFAGLCEQSDAELLPFLGTRDAARDLEVLRGALNEDQLNYLGKSYGTFLGAEFARQFPSKVGRFVLDGAIDPSLNADNYARGQATGFERALTAFIADCVKRKSCPLGRDPEKARERLDAYLDKLDQKPQKVRDRELTQALGTLGVLASFYSKSSWGTLRDALGKALRGDGSGLLRLADFYSDRQPNGSYRTNGLDAFYAISCMDREDPKGVDDTKALATTLTEEVSRTFGAYLAWGNTPCQSWTQKPTLVPAAVAAAGAEPIIVIGTTRDPATPYEWSVALAEQLDSGVLVSWDGDGHTAYGNGSTCVDKVVDRYFTSGKAPSAEVRC